MGRVGTGATGEAGIGATASAIGALTKRLTENELSDFTRLWHDGCGEAISEHKMWTEITRRKYEREGRHYASNLTDAEWALIQSHMPAAKCSSANYRIDF